MSKYTIDDAIKSEPKTIHAVWGMPIKQEILAVCEDGQVRKVVFGVADTFFTCPAMCRMDHQNTKYGFISKDVLPDYQTHDVFKFTTVEDQIEAKAKYQNSILS